MNVYLQNAYYLMIKSNFYHDNLDAALLNLLVIVLKKKNYETITDLGIVAKDFSKIIGFEIDVFMLKTIMQNASKKGLVAINDRTYMPCYDLINKESMDSEINKREKEIKNLISSFFSFLSTEFPEQEYTLEYAEKLIDEFVETQGVIFYKDTATYLSNPQTDFVFASFLKDRNNEHFCPLVCELVSGRVLTELVTHKDVDVYNGFSNTVVYLDAGILFSLLDVDELHRGEYYKKLLEDMRSIGISIKAFRHTVTEVETIIGNSIQWINNPDYDRNLATKATVFFNDNNYSKDKVEDLLYSMSAKLLTLSIDIEDIEYPQLLPDKAYTQADYYEAIKNYYLEKNYFLDEYELSNTIDKDAQSFLYVAAKNNFTSSASVTETKHFLLSDNGSLAIVAKMMCRSSRELPLCVSDTFFGAMIWKNNSAKLTEQSQQKLSNFLYQAFLPTESLSKKLQEVAEASVESGDLPVEEYIILKQNKIAAEMLVKITAADIDKVTDKTPFEIMARIKKEQREIGIRETEEKYQPILYEKDNLINAANQKLHDTETSYLGEQIRHRETNINHTKEKIQDITAKRTKIDNRVNCVFMWIGIILAVFLVSGIVLFLIASFRYQFSNKVLNFISVLGLVLAIVPCISGFIINCITNKTLNLAAMPSQLRTHYKQKAYKKDCCDDAKLDALKSTLQNLESEHNTLKKDQERHCFACVD